MTKKFQYFMDGKYGDEFEADNLAHALEKVLNWNGIDVNEIGDNDD